jgi:hypothetical protein
MQFIYSKENIEFNISQKICFTPFDDVSVSNDYIIIPPRNKTMCMHIGIPFFADGGVLRAKDGNGKEMAFTNEEFVILKKNKSGIMEFINENATILATLQSSMVASEMMDHQDYAQQVIVSEYIKNDDRVLELGGIDTANVSAIIGKILLNNDDYIVYKPTNEEVQQTMARRDECQLTFQVDVGVVSSLPLVKNFEIVKVLDPALDDKETWKPMTTLSYQDVLSKYYHPQPNIKKPNVLVVSNNKETCLLTLKDFPEMMDGVRCIILKNDFQMFTDLIETQRILKSNGFACDCRVGAFSGTYQWNLFEAWVPV